MARFADSVSNRSGIIGTQDPNGYSYQADVDSSSRLLVNVQTSAGGVLNATGQVSVGATATQIIEANTRQAVVITNPSSTVTVYIGGSGVTSSNGQELLPGNSITIPVTSAIYGIVATGAQTVSFLEVV